MTTSLLMGNTEDFQVNLSHLSCILTICIYLIEQLIYNYKYNSVGLRKYFEILLKIQMQTAFCPQNVSQFTII